MKLKLKCALTLFKKYRINSNRKSFNKLKVLSLKKDNDFLCDKTDNTHKLSYKKSRYDNNNTETYSHIKGG